MAWCTSAQTNVEVLAFRLVDIATKQLKAQVDKFNAALEDFKPDATAKVE